MKSWISALALMLSPAIALAYVPSEHEVIEVTVVADVIAKFKAENAELLQKASTLRGNLELSLPNNLVLSSPSEASEKRLTPAIANLKSAREVMTELTKAYIAVYPKILDAIDSQTTDLPKTWRETLKKYWLRQIVSSNMYLTSAMSQTDIESVSQANENIVGALGESIHPYLIKAIDEASKLESHLQQIQIEFLETGDNYTKTVQLYKDISIGPANGGKGWFRGEIETLLGAVSFEDRGYGRFENASIDRQLTQLANGLLEVTIRRTDEPPSQRIGEAVNLLPVDLSACEAKKNYVQFPKMRLNKHLIQSFSENGEEKVWKIDCRYTYYGDTHISKWDGKERTVLLKGGSGFDYPKFYAEQLVDLWMYGFVRQSNR